MEIASHLLAIAGLLLLLVSLYTNLWRLGFGVQKSKGMLAPEPSGALPIIGHLHQLRGKIPLARTLAAMADRHGPIFKIRLGSKSAFVVCSHEAVKECFTRNDKVLAGRPKSTQSKYLGYNNAGIGFAPYGEYFREMRKLAMTELLSARRLETLKNVQVSEVDAFIKDLYCLCQSNIHSPVKVVISEWIERLTLNIITKIIGGNRYFGNANGGDDEEAKRAGRIIKEFMNVVGAPVISDLLPFLGWIDFGGQVKSVKRLGRELDTLIGSWIEEHTLKMPEGDQESHNGRDFIDILLSRIEGDSIFGHTRETIIKATVSTMILGGTETTSVNLIWVLSLLLNNERALRRAQEELDLKVGNDRWVEDYDIKDMVYLQAIVKESLRLYPPAPLAVPHEALEDCQVCGYYIPKGSRLMVNVWKLHRDQRVWENPDVFFPERFLTSHAHIDALGQHFEFIPFGLGRRSCPGNIYAMQVSHLALARLLQGFELTTPENIPVDMNEGLGTTLPRSTPLQVLLTPRLSSELYAVM